MKNQYVHEWPENVPFDYAKPSKSYIYSMIIAVAGILIFIAIYFGLIYWFASASFKLFEQVNNTHGNKIINIFGGVINGFIAVFLIKSLFFRASEKRKDLMEIHEENEPVLFHFIYELADKAGAPRPHRIYLSTQVNASVFFEITSLNLFFPTKKNLEIGLGLVNVLSIGEFRAVLAHEFGHFAQKSMLLGSWVYVAYRVAVYLLSTRDNFDIFLVNLSRIDLRVAWIGWIVSTIIWAIRSLIDIIFRLVVLAHRKLSREMEFQADLVSVSLTGSDALINGLYKMQLAENALHDAIQTGGRELSKNKLIQDVFDLQSNAINQYRRILNDDYHGKVPLEGKNDPENFRLFKSNITHTSKMWETHPANFEREENAKKNFIKATIDARESWTLFSNKAEIRQKMTTQHLYILDEGKEYSPFPTEESINSQNKFYNKKHLDAKYQGIYFQILLYKNVRSMEEVESNDTIPTITAQTFENLYPVEIQSEIELYRIHQEELNLLTVQKLKKINITGEKLVYRGKEIKRNQLKDLLENKKIELKNAESTLLKRLYNIRNIHLKAAENINQNLAENLRRLSQIIHYCEHSISDINNCYNNMNQTIQVLTASGSVSSDQLGKILSAAYELHNILKSHFSNQFKVVIDEKVAQHIGENTWEERLEPFKLSIPTADNISSWLNLIDGWVNSIVSALADLNSATLDTLLELEEQIGKYYTVNQKLDFENPSISMESNYPRLMEKEERQLKVKITDWEKFRTGDGFIPGLARTIAAILILAVSIGFSNEFVSTKIYLYNGLLTKVTCNFNGTDYIIEPQSFVSLKTHHTGDTHIETKLLSGEVVEDIKVLINSTTKTYIYNVAKAALLYEYTVHYGYSNFQGNDEYILGNVSWSTSEYEYIMEEPPASVNIKGNYATRSAFSAIKPESLNSILHLFDDPKKMKDYVASHAAWDDQNSILMLEVLYKAREFSMHDSLIQLRLKRNPNEIASLRCWVDFADGEEKEKRCQYLSEMAAANPDAASYAYLSCRCLTNYSERSDCMHKAYTKWPNESFLKLAQGAVFADHNQWTDAYTFYTSAETEIPSLRMSLAIEKERIRRILPGEESVDFLTHWKQSDYLDLIYLIETNDKSLKNSHFIAYCHLMNGDIPSAITSAQNSELSQQILLLAAASEPTNKDLVREALTLTVDSPGIDNNTIWSAMGLAIRYKKNIESFKPLLQEILDDESDSIFHFIRACEQRNYTKAANCLLGQSVGIRAQAYTMAIVAGYPSIPKDWEKQARLFLFPIERPYFPPFNEKKNS